MLFVVRQRLHFMLVRSKDVLLAAAKVGVDLSWQERIFRDVGESRIVVQWQQ